MLTEYISGGPAATSFNIKVRFEGSNWTDAYQNAFITAADFLSTVITGDMPNVADIDDIVIQARMSPIDGEGGVLGQAGPTALFLRADNTPVFGTMEFDTADSLSYLNQGLFDDIVTHEMIHVLGFGTLTDPDFMNLVQNFGTAEAPDYRWVGQNAIHEYKALFPDQYAADPNPGRGVPIESDQGGAGTLGGHWDETTFTTEMMTGFLGTNAVYTNMTTAALQDMGYKTNYKPTPIQSGPICFTSGTVFESLKGDVMAEDLCVGDFLRSHDNGYAVIRYIYKNTVPAKGVSAPVVFAKGAIGNTEEMRVSQLHRFLTDCLPVEIRDAMKLPTGTLVQAQSLVNGDSIRIIESDEPVTYYHILFDQHELLYAFGTVSESWQPHKRMLKRVEQSVRNELLTLIPELASSDSKGLGRTVRPELTPNLQTVLQARFLN